MGDLDQAKAFYVKRSVVQRPGMAVITVVLGGLIHRDPPQSGLEGWSWPDSPACSLVTALGAVAGVRS